jgi:hypothetical protein
MEEPCGRGKNRESDESRQIVISPMITLHLSLGICAMVFSPAQTLLATASFSRRLCVSNPISGAKLFQARDHRRRFHRLPSYQR